MGMIFMHLNTPGFNYYFNQELSHNRSLEARCFEHHLPASICPLINTDDKVVITLFTIQYIPSPAGMLRLFLQHEILIRSSSSQRVTHRVFTDIFVFVSFSGYLNQPITRGMSLRAA